MFGDGIIPRGTKLATASGQVFYTARRTVPGRSVPALSKPWRWWCPWRYWTCRVGAVGPRLEP